MKKIALYILTLAALTSCIREDSFPNTQRGNYDALWSIIDERYCFFAEAEEKYGLDWNEVYLRYLPDDEAELTNAELFDLLGNMLRELRDGHVNLASVYGTSYYHDWSLDYPLNFSDSIQRNYLGKDYRLTNSIKYTTFADSVGYAYIGSFSNSFGADNIGYMLMNMSHCKGVILDIRNNGGGMITAAEGLASHFLAEEKCVGYMQHKTGKGHNDFSAPEEIILTPSNGVIWLRPVVVLTNRSVYSAANHFTMIMKETPYTTVIGDTTGGGSGMPLNSTLPNGWNVRFSACPVLDTDMQHNEFGTAPDSVVHITSEDWNRGRDTMIEAARAAIIREWDEKTSKR